MAAKKGDRVLGPYREMKHGRERWRVLVYLNGAPAPQKHSFEAQDAAERFARGARGEAQAAAERTIGQALTAWADELRSLVKPITITSALQRTRSLVDADLDRPLRWLQQDPKRGQELYKALQKRPPRRNVVGPPGSLTGELIRAIEAAGEAGYQADGCRQRHALRRLQQNGVVRLMAEGKGERRYLLAEPIAEKVLSATQHRRALREAKRWATWCVGQGWLSRNPFEGVKGEGRIGKRKTQLRLQEARIFYRQALQEARAGAEGPLAVLTALLLGLRASEVTERVVRDLDKMTRMSAEGTVVVVGLLHIDDGKTEGSKGTIEVPDDIWPLLERLAKSKTPLAPLFGEGKPHSPKWPRWWTRQLCRRSGVGLNEHGRPLICAHSLRGMFGSMGVTAGQMPHVVSAALRHGDERVSRQHYIEPGAITMAQQARVVDQLTSET